MSQTENEDKPISIFIATPMFGGQCFGLYNRSCLHLQRLCDKFGIVTEFSYLFNESLVQRGRNALVSDFLKTDFTHLMFIDADIGFNCEDVVRLVAADKDIIGGTYPRKKINWQNIKAAIGVNPNITDEELEIFAADYIYKVAPGVEAFATDEPVEVVNLPTGFMCIKREVILDMIEKYPNTEHIELNTASGQPETRYALFDCGINEHGEYLSEDFWFCKKAKEIGYKLYLLPDINLTHMGTFAFKGSIPLLGKYMTMYKQQAETKTCK